MLDAALGVVEEVCAQQQAAVIADPIRAQPHLLLADLGELAQALPALASICAPLAHAKLASLLDRTATCSQHVAALVARCAGASQVPTAVAAATAARLPPQGVAAVLDALAATAGWRQEPPVPWGLQRRLLAVLSWTVVAKAEAEV